MGTVTTEQTDTETPARLVGYMLWVPTTEATTDDGRAAFARWYAAVTARGFTPYGAAALVPVVQESGKPGWYVSGQVTPGR